MQTSEWINLSLALATVFGVIVALIFAIKSVRESRNAQLVRYKSELLEKISDWLNNVQACVVSSSSFDACEPTLNKQASLVLDTRKRAVMFAKVLEEGRNVFGIARLFGNDLYESTKSLENALQGITETFFKYSKLLMETSKDDLDKICTELEKEDSSNMKSLDKAIVKLVVEISDARIFLFDSISTGSDPFRNI